MGQKEKEYKCSECGILSSVKFYHDVCPTCNLPFWKCQNCGYTLSAKSPPDFCPECQTPCDFLNITSYTPDFGGPGNIDPRL